MANKNKGPQILDSFTDLANIPNFVGDTDPAVTETVYDADFAQDVLDTKDLIAEPGAIVGTVGPVSEISISARECIFEPAVIEQMLSTHAPYRTKVNPLRINFNTDGQLVALNNATSLDYTPDRSKTITPDGPFATQYFLGVVVRAVVADTQQGEGSFEITTDAGFEAEYVLNNGNEESIVCVLSHAADFNAQSTVLVTPPEIGGEAAQCNEQQVYTNVTDQFFFHPNFDTIYSFSGANTIMHIYPLYMTRPLQALTMAALTADRLQDLANFIAQGYEL